MSKRLFKIIAVAMAVCVMLTSCSFVDNLPFLPDKAVDSLAGAFTFMGDLMDQIKKEGLSGITSIFSAGDDDAESSQGDQGSSNQDQGSSDGQSSSSSQSE